MALTDKKIIITRAQEQISEARKIFRENGAEVFDLPSLVIGPPDDWAPLDDALKEIATFDWIIFSSANGVRNVEDRLKEIGLSLSTISKTIQIAAVGRKTASLLSDIDAKVSFVPPSFVADSLVEYFPQNQKGLKLFIPRVQTGGRSILSDSFKLKISYELPQVLANLMKANILGGMVTQELQKNLDGFKDLVEKSA